MNYQTQIIEATKNAAEEYFRYAVAVPEDKLDWKPLDAGRSVLNMSREVAKAPDWAYELVADDKPFSFDESRMAEQQAEMEAWNTIAECRAACTTRLEKLAKLYSSIPDAKLTATKHLPFAGGRDHTWAEMMDYPRWNCTYHLGQVAYIQTLYGDKNMY